MGDGGQGWGNALLYVFLSPVIRKELVFGPFFKCVEFTGWAIKTTGEKIETVGRKNRQGNVVEQQTHPPNASVPARQSRSFNRYGSIIRVNSSDVRGAHTGPTEEASTAPPLLQDQIESIQESSG